MNLSAFGDEDMHLMLLKAFGPFPPISADYSFLITLLASTHEEGLTQDKLLGFLTCYYQHSDLKAVFKCSAHLNFNSKHDFVVLVFSQWLQETIL